MPVHVASTDIGQLAYLRCTGQAAEHKSVPVRESSIEVQVGAAAAMQFVTANWQQVRAAIC